MLAFVASVLITWIVIGLIGYLLSDLSFRDCLTHGGTLMLMLIFGWIPGIIVGCDVNDRLNSYL